MIKQIPRVSLILLLLSGVAVASSEGSLVAQELRCEDQQTPLAIQSRQPRFGWVLAPSDPAARGLRQTAYRIMVASSVSLLASDRTDLWDTGKVSSTETMQIRYGGLALRATKKYYWAVTVWDQEDRPSHLAALASFSMGMLEPTDWKAKWIRGEDANNRPLPIFRYEFSVDKPIASAMAYVSGLGQYELQINGKRIGDAVLTPGWTNYRKTVFYNAYDVSSTLKEGRNAIGIMLGNGMYKVEDTPDRYSKFTGSFGKLKLIFQARLIFTDGSFSVVRSNASWKVHDGPITFSSTYGGEDYDARLEQVGWSEPDFSDRSWGNATETVGPGGVLTSEENPAIRVRHVYLPARVTHPFPRVSIYDLGQNFAGWPEIEVRGTPGSKVKLVAGELLDSAGFVRQTSSGEPQSFSYVLSGKGRETWHPRFSYYGFRYIQAEVSGEAELLDVRGAFLHADVATVGEFKCSDELLNRIHQLINAAILSNMQSVLTDCPHREKLGWLEESHLLGRAIMCNYDVARLYQKISDDLRDAEAANGFVPEIAPEFAVFPGMFHDSPEWSSAIVLNPWIAYEQYGSTAELTKHYEEMSRYLGYLTRKAQQGVLAYGLGDWYDIGPGEPGSSKLTSLGVTGTAIYYADAVALQKCAQVLGKTEDAIAFQRLAASVKRTFNGRFYNPTTHVYDRGSQTDYAMPLALNLVPATDRKIVLDKLVEDIRQHQNHVTAGDIGFHFLVTALMEGGRSDVLYDMLERTDSPSYGYQLAMGATSLTEAWDANPLDSQNHFMLGHAEEWFYRGLAGLDFDLSRPWEERIVFRPALVGTVSAAEANDRSVIGTVAVSWTRENGNFSMNITVPPNAAAMVWVPAETRDSVQLPNARDVSFVRTEAGFMIYRVGSGSYRFTTGR